jgi:hypothetical protein
MQTDALIRSLSADLRPVQRLPAPARRCARWALAAGAFVVANILLAGLRADLAAQTTNPAFLLKGAALLLIFVLSAKSAFELSVPDDSRALSKRCLPALALSVWLVLLVLLDQRGLDGSEAALRGGLPCVLRIAVLGALPACACLAMVRRAAPLERRWCGLLACLAAFSLAALGTQLLCARDGLLHMLLWHALPVSLLGLAGGWLGESMLRRGRAAPPSCPF